MNIVVVNPSAASLSGAHQLAEATVVFAAWAGTALPEDGSTLHRVSVPRPERGTLATRTVDALGGSPVGRNLLRLSPLDTGRAFARNAARVPELRAAIAQADLVIAAERDAILTVWRLGRELAPPSARLIYGMAPAQSLLAELS